MFLWLGCRPVAAAHIRPLAWELPYAAGTALEKDKRQKKKKRKRKKENISIKELHRIPFFWPCLLHAKVPRLEIKLPRLEIKLAP